jgi:glycosyltransferase involved in cell wall biosynthesis
MALKRAVLGVFFGPHYLHKKAFDLLAKGADSVESANFRTLVLSNLTMAGKLLATIFHPKVILWFFRHFFDSKTMILEGFYPLSLYSFLGVRCIAISSEQVAYRVVTDGFYSDAVRAAYRFFFRRVHHFLVYSEMVSEVLQKMGIPQNRISILPAFIPNEDRYAEETDVPASNLSKKRFVTVANGDDYEYKGLDFLNVLAKEMAADGWVVEVIGRWNESIQKKFPHLRFLGFLGQEEMLRYLRKNATFGIFSGVGEAFSCAALEMAYSGIPVIVRESVGFKEILSGA